MATRNQLRADVERINRHGAQLSIRTGYGKVGVSSLDGGRDLTPLWTAKEVEIWLRGYEQRQDEESEAKRLEREAWQVKDISPRMKQILAQEEFENRRWAALSSGVKEVLYTSGGDTEGRWAEVYQCRLIERAGARGKKERVGTVTVKGPYGSVENTLLCNVIDWR